MTDLPGYAPLSEKVAALPAEDDLVLSPQDFPADCPDHLPFDGLVIDTNYQRQLGWPGEGDCPFEVIDRAFGFKVMALPEGYRRFGLWLVHLLFSGREWAGLELTHPKSRARVFYARVLHPIEHYYGVQRAGPRRSPVSGMPRSPFTATPLQTP